MLRRALVVNFAIGPAALPAASQAYDIKPKTPETAFAGKTASRISWASRRIPPPNPRAPFSSHSFKGRTDTKTDIQQPKFGGTNISYICGADVQRCLPAPPDRRSAVGQLLLACQRQPRLFHRTQPDFREGPAAGQGRDDQASDGQIRRADHRRRSASLLHLSRGQDRVGRREVQGSGSDRGHRQAARSERWRSNSTATTAAAVASPSSSARWQRRRRWTRCSTKPRAPIATAC